ncbi:NB-ARC domain-containing protein [Amycolatopsis sp. NPDC004079]|uniref:NB-ARC domain-containing protein n=1 Tax=Amycolatopsis sp. NPDC004079 TaxID=3154549 RepID=UPI0033A11A9C
MTARRTVPRAPVQLPPSPTLLVGRDADLARLDEIADRPGPRLVVVSGVAGIGKTAVALRWLHDRRSRFPGGILHARLAPGPEISDAETDVLLHGFLCALGVPPGEILEAPGQRAGQFRALTDGRAFAVLLDHAWRSEDVRALLPSSERAVVVVTSQSQLPALVLDGAEQLVLSPLSPDHARELFVRRARPVDVAPADVDAVLQRCGGLPLSVSIEAARWRTRPHRSARTAAPPDTPWQTGDFATMASVYDSAYQSVPDPVRRYYRGLGRLPFTYHDPDVLAEAFNCTIKELQKAFESLAEVNFLDEPHENAVALVGMVRPDARRRADASGEDADLLLRYIRALAARVSAGSKDVHSFRPRLEPDADTDGPAVFATPGDAMQWWHRHREAVYAVAAEAAADESLNEDLWRLAEAVWGFFLHLRDYDRFRELCLAGLEAARQCRNPTAEALMHLQAGFADSEQGRLDDALAHLEAAQEIGEREQSGPILATCCSRRARDARARGRLEGPDGALAWYERSIEKHFEIGRPRGAHMGRRRRAEVLIMLGRENEAWRELIEVARYMEAIGDVAQLAKALVPFADMQARHGERDAARDRLQEVLAQAENIQSAETEELLRTALAALEPAAGDTAPDDTSTHDGQDVSLPAGLQQPAASHQDADNRPAAATDAEDCARNENR